RPYRRQRDLPGIRHHPHAREAQIQDAVPDERAKSRFHHPPRPGAQQSAHRLPAADQIGGVAGRRAARWRGFAADGPRRQVVAEPPQTLPPHDSSKPSSGWAAVILSSSALALTLTGDQLLYVVLPLEAEIGRASCR